jgi:hypothetical protein
MRPKGRFHQLLESVSVTTGFDTHHYFPLKLAVELLDVITLMIQLHLPDGPILGVQVREGLLSRVNVDSDI